MKNNDELNKSINYEIIGEEPMNEQSKSNENNDMDCEDEEDEEEDEEDKNENVTEAKDFMYFKRQCKFERFVNQMSKNGKGGAFASLIGGHVNTNKQTDNQDEDEKSNLNSDGEGEDGESEEEIVGFDTRFTYTREGLMVYDITANTKLDKFKAETNGISHQDYKVFCHTTPYIKRQDDLKPDYFEKFKSYTSALAPFAGLDLATEHGTYFWF